MTGSWFSFLITVELWFGGVLSGISMTVETPFKF